MDKKIITVLAIVGVIAIISLALIGFASLNNPVSDVIEKLGGGGQTTVYQTLAGTATQFIAMPESEVNAKSTTTDALAWDPSTAGTIIQELDVSGITRISLIVEAEGGTATSTLSVKPFISYDGTTFSEIYASSSPLMNTTSSIPTLAKVDTFDPGVTTSTKAWQIDIPTANKVRLVWMGEDLSTDPTDGVKAHIQIGLEAGY